MKLTVLAVAVLMVGCLIERTPLGDAMLRALDRVTAWLRDNTELLIRAGCGCYTTEEEVDRLIDGVRRC